MSWRGGKSDCGSGKAETMGTDVKKLDSSKGSAPEDVVETGNEGKRKPSSVQYVNLLLENSESLLCLQNKIKKVTQPIPRRGDKLALLVSQHERFTSGGWTGSSLARGG